MPSSGDAAPQVVDLRSDTVTRPSPEMRAAMAAAEVGDDVYGEDPTVDALERRAAELTGMEAGLFVPSGTMGNQLAVRVSATQGDEVYVHADSHLMSNEGGGISALWGVQARALPGEHGRIDLDQLVRYVPDDIDDPHLALPRLVCVENTHMWSGGRVYPLAELGRLGTTARRLHLRVHMDGARIVNAAVASGRSLAEICAPVDTVQFCLSKGLGAPVGSVLCGSAEAIGRARRGRKLLGGGMRQAGVVAAAGLWALEHNVERLADDHARARTLAEALTECPRVDVDPAQVETNIVLARVRDPDDDPRAVIADLAAEGVLGGELGDHRTVRLVTHLDVDDAALERACWSCRKALRRLA
jgi:threonine aldolase